MTITVENGFRVIIQDQEVNGHNNTNGIHLKNCDSCRVLYNVLTNCMIGIWIDKGKRNILAGNQFNSCNKDIQDDGVQTRIL
jgi:parallel beta-helix repeat protein